LILSVSDGAAATTTRLNPAVDAMPGVAEERYALSG
jgi:hypothetical protein